MAKSSKITEDTGTKPVQTQASELAQALREVVEAVKPQEKKNIFNRKANTPWTPKDGSPKLKLKRKIYQHGIELKDKRLTNEQIALCNKLRPGVFFDGWVNVIRRRDKGIDIDYPIRSRQQSLKLVSTYGVRSFTELLQKLVDEAAKPRKSEFELDVE